MHWFLAGTAAIALAASGAIAQPGNGNGNGNGKGGPAHAQSGNHGGGNANRGNGGGKQNAQRGNGGGNSQQANRGNGGGNAKSDRGNGNDSPARAIANRGNGNGNPVHAGNNGRGQSIATRNMGRGDANARGADRRIASYDGPSRYIDRTYYSERDVRSNIVLDGCPPGLAKKYNGCRPPGQARKDGFLRRDSYSPDWWGLSRYRDSYNYRYDGGYLVRLLTDGSVGSYIPLLGGALSLGSTWPRSYGYTNLSPYYSDYYDLGGPNNYRYADNVVYRLEPETRAITSIAALLTGDDFTIGQRMPQGYDIYNVPPSYRDRYYDRPDAMYRYSDGYIYQMDPETRLVAAAIELLAT